MNFGWIDLYRLITDAPASVDLRRVRWIEADVLLPLTCWLRARPDAARVTVLGPSSVDTARFLWRCGFSELLEEVGIAFKSPNVRGERGRFSRLELFFDAEGAKRAFSNVVLQRELGLWDVSDLRQESSSGITSVIVDQLVENIREHAANCLAGVYMQTLPIYSWGNQQSPRRAQFFSAAESGDILSITLVDTGPGIPVTISEKYAELHDGVLPNDREAIRFACQRTSSSKRINSMEVLERLITRRGAAAGAAGTGLFFVQETCRDLRAFFEIRSGRGVVQADYLNAPDERPGLYSEVLDLGWPGTVVQIFVPLGKLPDVQRDLPARAIRKQGRIDFSLSLYPVQERTPVHTADNISDWAAWLDAALDEVDALAPTTPEISTLVIIDCAGLKGITANAARALFLLCVYLMQQGSRGILVGLREPPSILTLTFRDLRLGGPRPVDWRPVLITGDDTSAHLLGTEILDKVGRSLEGAFRGQLTPLSALPEIDPIELARDIEPFLALETTGNIIAKLSLTLLHESLEAQYREYLRKQLENPASGILHRSERTIYRLPSGGYTTTFFALGQIKGGSFLSEVAATLLSNEIKSLAPQIVLAIDRVSGPIAKSAAIRSGTGAEVLETVVTPAGFSRILRALGRTDPVGLRALIVTDVVSSGLSLRLAVEYSHHAGLQVVGTHALLDARERTGSVVEEIPHTEAVHYPLEVHQLLPTRFSFADVVIIDPDTHLPELRPYLPRDPIRWKVNPADGTSELAETVLQGGFFAAGHFEGGGRHLPYALDTDGLLRQSIEGIGKTITTEIKKFLLAAPVAGVPITHVVYPGHTYGIGTLARRVALDFASELVRVGAGDLRSPVAGQLTNARGVILIDDASASGHTVRRLIDFADVNGATYVCAFILANRAGRVEARTVLRIERYGNLQVYVRHLGEFPIPAFSVAECPICARVHDLWLLRSRRKDLEELIRKELEAYRLVDINSPRMDRWATGPWADVNPAAVVRARYRIELARDIPAAIGVVEPILSSTHGGISDDAIALAVAIGHEERYFRKHREQFAAIFHGETVERFKQSCENAIFSTDSRLAGAVPYLIKCIRALTENAEFLAWASSLKSTIPPLHIPGVELELGLAELHESVGI
jgi:orotate phosphoribosyltransferase